jgi:hypothetical protein
MGGGVVSSFYSPVNTLHELFIHQLPAGRTVAIERVVRVNRITVMVGKNGKLYCDQLKPFCYALGEWPFNDSLMKALVKLKVVTSAQMDDHLASCKAASVRKSKRHAKEMMERYAEEHGFKLTKLQMAAVSG